MSPDLQPTAAIYNLLDYDARRFTSAEMQLKKVLPDWISKAGSLELKTALEKYMAFTEEHIQKMDSFIKTSKKTLPTLSNRVMQSFIQEAKEKLKSRSDAMFKDACLIDCVLEITRFKINTYGTAAAFAKAVELSQPASVFHEAEVQELQMNKRLAELVIEDNFA